jgi:hypothetical protein
MTLTDRLEADYRNALTQSSGLHSTNIRDSFLSVFIRVAKEDASKLDAAISTLLHNMEQHASNRVASLYCLAKLASQSVTARDVVREKLPGDFLEYYRADDNPDIAGNAEVLAAVLSGRPIPQFERVNESVAPSIVNNFYGNVGAIGSHGAKVQFAINPQTLDEDTQELLLSLKNALDEGDSATTKRLVTALADKGADFMVQLLTGGLLKLVGG